MERKARTNKILLLGVDGLDPSLTKHYIEEGLLPNLKEYVERGAQRKDLVMLGGHPTVTPPMWTTLATGCYSNVHGITGFSVKAVTLTRPLTILTLVTARLNNSGTFLLKLAKRPSYGTGLVPLGRQALTVRT